MNSSAKPNRDDDIEHVGSKIYQVAKEKFPWKGKKRPSNKEIVKVTTDITNKVSNVVDLSMTELKMADLKTLWGTIEEFNNLTSLELAMDEQFSIRLEDCGVELKKKLKRLRMKAKIFPIGSGSSRTKSGLESLHVFQGLIDLTLTSETTIEVIDKIPRIKTLQCLRLYGDSKKKICKIELQGFDSLKKLVIGDMRLVQKVEIGSAVIKNIATLKLDNLQELKEVAYYSDKQNSSIQHSLLKWENNVCTDTVKLAETAKLDETIFLRQFNPFPREIRQDLMIYHSEKDKLCYKYIVC